MQIQRQASGASEQWAQCDEQTEKRQWVAQTGGPPSSEGEKSEAIRRGKSGFTDTFMSGGESEPQYMDDWDEYSMNSSGTSHMRTRSNLNTGTLSHGGTSNFNNTG